MCFMNEARVVCPFKHGQRKAFALCVVRRMTDESESARSSTRRCLSLACGTLPVQCMYIVLLLAKSPLSTRAAFTFLESPTFPDIKRICTV